MPVPAEIVNAEEVVVYLGLTTVAAMDMQLIEQIKGYVEDEFRSYCGHGITIPDSAYVEFYPKVDRPFEASEDTLIALDADAQTVIFDLPVREGHILQLDNIFAVDDSTLEVRDDRDAYFGVESGDFAASTALTKGTDYYLELDEAGLSKSGRLIRRTIDWPGRAGTVQVTYNAGLSVDNLTRTWRWVKGAVVEVVARRFRRAKSSGGATGQSAPIKSEQFGGEYSVTYAVEQVGVGEASLPKDIKRRLRRGGLVNAGRFIDM